MTSRSGGRTRTRRPPPTTRTSDGERAQVFSRLGRVVEVDQRGSALVAPTETTRSRGRQTRGGSPGGRTTPRIVPQPPALGHPTPGLMRSTPGSWKGSLKKGRARQTTCRLARTSAAKAERTKNGGMTTTVTDRGIGEVTGAIANQWIGTAPRVGYPTLEAIARAAMRSPTQLRFQRVRTLTKTTVLYPETSMSCGTRVVVLYLSARVQAKLGFTTPSLTPDAFASGRGGKGPRRAQQKAVLREEQCAGG